MLAPASRRHQEQHQHHHHEHIPTLQSLRSVPAAAHSSGHQPQDSQQPAIRLTTRSSLPSLRHSSSAAPLQQGHMRASHAPHGSLPDGSGLSGSGSAMLSWLQKLVGRQGSQRSGLEGQAGAGGSFQDRHLPGPYV